MRYAGSFAVVAFVMAPAALVGLRAPALAAEATIEEMLDAVGAEAGGGGALVPGTERRGAMGAGLRLEGVALTGAARARLDAEFDAFDRLLDGRDYAAARERTLRAAAGPALAEAAGLLEAAAHLAGVLEQRTIAIRRSMEATKGAKVTLRTKAGLRKGTVESVTDAGVGLVAKIIINRQTRGVKRFTVAWADLAPEEDERLARDWQPDGAAGALARAALAISAGRTEAAERELEAAVGHPLVERYHRKVEAVGLARAENDAGAAWAMIERLSTRKGLSAEQARALTDLVAAFKEHHGVTDLGKSRRKALAKAEGIALRVLMGHGEIEGSVEFGGHRYKFYRWAAPWAETKRFCERLGGHLATITSAEENAFIVHMARNERQRFWIGLSDGETEGDFAWVTGEKSPYFSWANDEPSGGARENDVSMDPRSAFGWRSTPKRRFNFFVCEWEPPRRGQRPAKSTSEEPAEVPPGARKVVLYHRDFEDGSGGWRGEVVRDPKSKSRVISLVPTPDSQYIAMRTGHWLGDRGFRTDVRARVSFKYRTEGPLSSVMCQNWYIPPEGEGANYYIVLPPSTGWARADFPISWMRRNGERPVDLSRGFRIRSFAVYGGKRGESGKTFIDDFEVYSIVRAKTGRKPKSKPRRRPRDR